MAWKWKISAAASFVFLLLVLSFSTANGQNMRKIDRLEMLYDQSNFRALVRRTDRMIRSDEYKNIAAPYFFRAMAKLQLNFESGIIQDRFSMGEIAADFQQFLKLDSNAYWATAYASYYYETRQEIYGYLGIAAGDDPENIVNEKFQELAVIFGNDIVFADVIAVSKEPVPVKIVPPAKRKGDIGEVVIDFAAMQLGKPYQFGATGPKSFDCSGFTWYVWSKHGYDLPRSSVDQSLNVQRIKLHQAKKGDLLFFGRNEKTISHVGIVVSDKNEPLRMIHASSSIGISYVTISEVEYWKNRLQFAGRVAK